MISSLDRLKQKTKRLKKKHIKFAGNILFWFTTGAILSLILISSFSYFAFQNYYKGKVYPGVSVNGVDFGRKSEEQVKKYFTDKNLKASGATFVFNYDSHTATVSAKDIDLGFDQNLLASQAMSIGRSNDPFSNITLIISAYMNGVNLSTAYRFSEEKLSEKLKPTTDAVNKKAIEALFNFEGEKVIEFRPSENGLEVDINKLNQLVLSKAKLVLNNTPHKVILISLPVKTIQPALTTDKVNKMGIRELIGSGTSTFKGSIENRIYNINLASSRLNGILIKPGDTFSFNKTIGDVSSLTGYKQAYVIQNGRTVLGDGGGVCQVSTTFFRAVLNTGLPIVERNQHAYRVAYYEQDSGPGIDAAIYTPNIDLRFKNDTGNHILVQTIIDNEEQRLTFMFYGTSDGRTSELTTPVILSQSPAPEPKYEDDPNLPKGQVKQVDFAAAGANVFFTRTVTRDGKTIISEKIASNYRPWQAVFLRGTKE